MFSAGYFGKAYFGGYYFGTLAPVPPKVSVPGFDKDYTTTTKPEVIKVTAVKADKGNLNILIKEDKELLTIIIRMIKLGII